MGVFQNALGMNLTDSMPIIRSPFNNSRSVASIFPPPSYDVMITEDGIYMITELTSSYMIVEQATPPSNTNMLTEDGLFMITEALSSLMITE